MSGNISSSVSHHLPQFFILPTLHQKTQQKTKRFSKKKHGLKGIRNTIEKKNRLFKKCIKCVDNDKNILH